MNTKNCLLGAGWLSLVLAASASCGIDAEHALAGDTDTVAGDRVAGDRDPRSGGQQQEVGESELQTVAPPIIKTWDDPSFEDTDIPLPKLMPWQPDDSRFSDSRSENLYIFSSDTAWDIPDAPHPGVSTSLEVPASDLDLARVRLRIEHSYIGDLRVALQAPSGQTLLLHERMGGSTDDLDLEVSVQAGVFEPEQSAGTWRLVLSDHAEQDTGSLVFCELAFTSFVPAPEDTDSDWGSDGSDNDGADSYWGSNSYWVSDDVYATDTDSVTDSGYGSSSRQPCYGVCWWGAHCSDYCPPRASCRQIVDDGPSYWEVLGCGVY